MGTKSAARKKRKYVKHISSYLQFEV